MMQFDWSKFTTIHGKPVTLVTNGYVQEPEGLRCNRTNGKSGYKRLRIAGGVTIIEEPVTKPVTRKGSNTEDVTGVTDVTTIKDNEIRYAIEERASILEFDAGLSREDAEAKAFAMMLQTDEKKKT
jgi:hypothetical protein